MKNLFLLLVLMFTLMLFSFTCAYSDELFLKDGSIIECKVLDIKNNESYMILFKDGSVVTYPVDKVKSVKITDTTQKDETGESLPAKSESGNANKIDSYQSISPTPVKHEKVESTIKFLASFSIVISPDYKDMLDDAYPDADTEDGGYGWLGIDLGAQIKVNDNFSVAPTIGLLFNYVSVETDYYYDSSHFEETDDYANYIIVPRIAARYKLTSSPLSPYVGAELNYNEPNTGSDRFELESGGLGYGAFLGFSPIGNMILEAGYLYVPVKWNIKDFDLPNDKKNIGGGFLIRVGAAF